MTEPEVTLQTYGHSPGLLPAEMQRQFAEIVRGADVKKTIEAYGGSGAGGLHTIVINKDGTHSCGTLGASGFLPWQESDGYA